MSLDVTLNETVETEVYWRNITHNLGTMANAAGLYTPLWRPEEINLRIGADLIPFLTEGLAKLKADPDKYKQYNPKNGWGSYEDLVKFVEEYLQACMENPTAKIEVSR